MSNFTEKLSALWDRLKKIKHIEIYICVFVALMIIGIYFLSFGKSDKTEQISAESDTSFSSSEEYAEYLENKLELVLAKVKGAGNVSVAITLEQGFEYVYATEEETRTSGGGQVTTRTPVMVDGKPVLEKKVYPKIKGVIVTSSGGGNITVKMNLLSALLTAVEVEGENVIILEGI